MSDGVVVGGGVIGLSLAWELAGQGAAVTVLDQGPCGREASWAGAGILPPGCVETARTPEQRLRAHSHALWPRLSEQLHDETGIDNGYRNCGGLGVSFGSAADLGGEVAHWTAEGVTVEPLTAEELRRVEPALNSALAAAYRLPEQSQVRNPRHVKALIAACAARGVVLREGMPALEFERHGKQIQAVRTPAGSITSGAFCIAAGAWAGRVAESVGLRLFVEPVRGQIVQVLTPPGLLRHVVEEGTRYLVPRPDGRLLIGATEERAGFDKRNTAGAVAALLRFATRLVPALETASLERTWAGFRPGTPDRLPFLGRAADLENLFVAAGHFRSGLQMSPATARVMRQLMLGQPLDFPLDGLEPDRFAHAAGPLPAALTGE
jgi:glycine oxidase